MVSHHAGMATYEVVRSKEDQSLAMIESDLYVITEYAYDVNVMNMMNGKIRY